MPSQPAKKTRHVSIDRIEDGLRVVAKQVEQNPAYLPLFERLLKEREECLARQSSLELAKQWAA